MVDYLLDSDVLIWMLRGHPEVVSFLRIITQQCLPACSPLSLLEVELGMKKGEEEKTLKLMDSLEVIPADKDIARKAAGYITHYEVRGRKIGLVDAVIAASAVVNGITLVTYNLKHYPMPELMKRTPHMEKEDIS